MPRRPAIRHINQYFQYHNRIASFHDWPLEWEVDSAKPSPEALARAGFFSHHVAPHEPDNVVCPYCKIYLDSWEPGDDPVAEHKLRSPHCDFVVGRARPNRADNNPAVAQVQSEMTETPANKDTGAKDDKEEQVSADVPSQTVEKGSTKGCARRGSSGRGRGRLRSSSGRGRVTKPPNGRDDKAGGFKLTVLA